VLSYWLSRWMELELRSKGGTLTATAALDRLKGIHLDELGIPGLAARWWAVKELAVEEKAIVDGLGIGSKVSDLPVTLA